MKRFILIMLSFVIIYLGVFIWMYANLDAVYDQEVSVFEIEDYNKFIKMFSSDVVLDPAENAGDAVERARAIWKDMFPQYKEKTVKVEYDAQSACWHIYGVLPPVRDIFGKEIPRLGGVPHMLVLEAGQVLAVWHTQ